MMASLETRRDREAAVAGSQAGCLPGTGPRGGLLMACVRSWQNESLAGKSIWIVASEPRNG